MRHQEKRERELQSVVESTSRSGGGWLSRSHGGVHLLLTVEIFSFSFSFSCSCVWVGACRGKTREGKEQQAYAKQTSVKSGHLRPYSCPTNQNARTPTNHRREIVSPHSRCNSGRYKKAVCVVVQHRLFSSRVPRPPPAPRSLSFECVPLSLSLSLLSGISLLRRDGSLVPCDRAHHVRAPRVVDRCAR